MTFDKKSLQTLQRAIVDGLEDVKAQDIQVFDTEAMSPLFERVIVASGTSNRQTKALAASVRDAVREAGFDKPRTEGEDNGEWIIVDCGPAVVHVMQPAIRQYYRLEEIWGDKPIRLKHGAQSKVAASETATKMGTKVPKTTKAAPAKPKAAVKSAAKAGGKSAVKPEAKSVAKKAPAKKAASTAKSSVKSNTKPLSRAPAKSVAKPAAKAAKPVAKSAAKPVTKTTAKPSSKPATKPAAKPVAKKAPAKKAPAKKAAPAKAPRRSA
jgi:ribosome-associated protein